MARRDALSKLPIPERTLFDYAYAAVAESGGKDTAPETLLQIAAELRAADLATLAASRFRTSWTEKVTRLEVIGTHECPTCGLWHGFDR